MQSRCQTAYRPPSAGLWEGPRLVKPTDGTGRAAVHRSWPLLMAAQMWDRQTDRRSALFTHGPPVCCVLVYLFSVDVLFSDCLPWQPLFCMVIFFLFYIFKHLAFVGPPEVP